MFAAEVHRRGFTIVTNIAPPPVTGNEWTATAAPLRARIGGYAVDMVILSAIAMVVTVLSGFVLLLSTDFAEQDPSNADVYVFTSVIGVGCTAIWTVLNLTLLALRRQSGGQYVAGIRLARSDGKPLSLYDLLIWWLCFNPLLFSWPVAAVVGFAVLLPAGLLDSRAMLTLGFFVIFVCLAAPIAAAVSALFDAQNRGLHDRIVGTIVVSA